MNTVKVSFLVREPEFFVQFYFVSGVTVTRIKKYKCNYNVAIINEFAATIRAINCIC